jgi:hypothetical protein
MTWTAPDVERAEPPYIADERRRLDSVLDFPAGAALLDQQCNVVSLASSGVHVLVQCFGLGFGRLDGNRFTPLAGFPSPASSGISGQSPAAW